MGKTGCFKQHSWRKLETLEVVIIQHSRARVSREEYSNRLTCMVVNPSVLCYDWLLPYRPLRKPEIDTLSLNSGSASIYCSGACGKKDKAQFSTVKQESHWH
jgi:hypothetical protein